VSQMPDVAGSWPENGTQYLPGAPMEPVQQPYQPQAQYQQQAYPQQGYGEQQQYAPQQPYGVPQQQQYPVAQPPYQEQTAPQQPMFFEEEQASVPSEFDHLFRDSSPENRKPISGGPAMVGGGPGAAASPAFQQAPPAVAQQLQAAQATAVYNPAQAQQGYEERGPGGYAGNQPFGGGYGPAGGNGGGNGGGGRRTPLIIGGVVVVVAAVGLYFGLSGGGSGSGPNPTASASTGAPHVSTETATQQAAAVYQLVAQSKQLRSDIDAEVGDDLDSCSNMSNLQSQIAGTASQRQAQADQVSELDVNKIVHGRELVNALNAAWTVSANSDNDYAKTAADVASNCTRAAVRSDPNTLAADQSSNRATQDKELAVRLWNQIMPNYGQPAIEESDL
jgi:hypothetical protein